MRKTQKKQAEDFLKLLGQAHTEIKRAMHNGKSAAAMDLLGQCQEGAIELGDMIEAEEGEGFVTIPILEAYCEQVYQIYEAVRQRGYADADKACKSLDKLLSRIRNSVRNDIKVRIEAVFLPYKASMWDSLESVWKAADKALDCDAYVIPIPYYDKNPDGSFGRMHYEGGLYPDYVPVVKYDEFNFAEHRPDMIFIHNPYDQYNYVTSVHPFFYSRNLKQYTEKLIYVPYFITKDEVPEQYCVLPGTINADKVYVHSEKAAGMYRERLGKFINRGDLEKKIVGIGSPKIDRVLEYEVDKSKIPEQWRNLLLHSDKKKIILYNTHLNGLMALNAHLTIEKIKNTLKWFQIRQDLLLWWRPHPLSIATARAVNPGVEEKYTEIVETYREEAWGIYDDTEDLNRAIALADAYFGDASSVLLLFKQTGKPILLQNRRVRQEIRK